MRIYVILISLGTALVGPIGVIIKIVYERFRAGLRIAVVIDICPCGRATLFQQTRSRDCCRTLVAIRIISLSTVTRQRRPSDTRTVSTRI